ELENTRCMMCGRPVASFFDHIDVNCMDWPAEPGLHETVDYRGWECSWDATADAWGANGWRAYKGGADIGAPELNAKTWLELMRLIDEEEGDD
ncbi:hypothetical protein, partial [Parvimonas micra]|uniref:hypothetical protein n=1 Tax=Parvimonas micra TaxID=33033 RepID=UPI002B4654BB